ncbi:MAG: uracil-DNA glycosylase family protein [Collinsella sp.]
MRLEKIYCVTPVCGRSESIGAAPAHGVAHSRHMAKGRARFRSMRSVPSWATAVRVSFARRARTSSLAWAIHAPRVMFVGEAPGKERGSAAASRSWARRVRTSIGILSLCRPRARGHRAIANVLKCRPPQNRNPQADEVLACSPYLREQIRSIWPDVIVTLGNRDAFRARDRGRHHQAARSFSSDGAFHRRCRRSIRAAALRNPAWQALLEADFRMLGDVPGANTPSTLV